MIYAIQVLRISTEWVPGDFDQAKHFLGQFAPAFSNVQLPSVGFQKKQASGISTLCLLCLGSHSFLQHPWLQAFTLLKCSHLLPQWILFSTGNQAF